MTGYEFVGHGEAISKAVAQDLAAARFVKYLQDKGLVSAGDLPAALSSGCLDTGGQSDDSHSSVSLFTLRRELY